MTRICTPTFLGESLRLSPVGKIIKNLTLREAKSKKIIPPLRY
jgi:hypothetical protein